MEMLSSFRGDKHEFSLVVMMKRIINGFHHCFFHVSIKICGLRLLPLFLPKRYLGFDT